MTPSLCPSCGYDQFAHLKGRWYCQGCWKPQDEPSAPAIDPQKLLDEMEATESE